MSINLHTYHLSDKLLCIMVDILRDTEGNKNFRSLRVGIGVGYASVRVYAPYAVEIAGKIMDVDLGQFFEDVKAEPNPPKNPLEFRARLAQKAAEQLSSEIAKRKAEENKDVWHDHLAG
jgi:hypothetical protein